METPLKILLLEDNDDDAELIQHELRRQKVSCELSQVRTRDAFAEALLRNSFDLILSDYTLPAFDGKSALRWARQRNVECPFIFVSGTIGEERAVESLKMGASDYVLKNRPERLGPVIRRALREAGERARRLESERKLVEAETQFRILVEKSLVATYIIKDGKFSYVNPKMTDLLGYGQEELTSRPLLDFVIEEDRTKVEENLRRRLEEGVESIHYELRLIRNDGAVVETEALGSRIELNGQSAIIGTLLDVTLNNWMERVLAESEAEFRTAFEWAPIGMVEMDLATGQFLRLNKRFCEMTGYSPTDLLQKSFLEIAHPDDHEANFDAFQGMLAGDNNGAWHKMRILKADGLIAWISLAASLVRDASGSPLRTIAVIQNLRPSDCAAL